MSFSIAVSRLMAQQKFVSNSRYYMNWTDAKADGFRAKKVKVIIVE